MILVLKLIQKKNNSILHIANDLNQLIKQKMINQKEKIILEQNINFKKNGSVFTLPDFSKNTLKSIAISKPSKTHRKSTIDQAAIIFSKLNNQIWDITFPSNFTNDDIYDFLIGWGLSSYKFVIKTNQKNHKFLNLKNFKKLPTNFINNLKSEIDGVFLARNLINLPGNFLNPKEYERQIKNIFKGTQFENIKINIFKGKNFDQEFPLIHYVGRSSEYKPRLIEICWKHKKSQPKPNIVIIGKGITFDSGGLDIKPSASMLLMKKDMGGSAIALALAKTLITQNFNINVRLIIPIAENSISERSMRPLDIILSRNNTPIEIGNTDAEGRLILADALSYSQEKIKPDLIIDFATLTGAARVALGTEVPAVFSNNDKISKMLIDNAFKTVDPLWTLPLFVSYERHLENENGTISSTGFAGTGGAITAALFLKKFIKKNTNWVHIDLMGWNLNGRPGYPKGGEAMTFRAVLHTIKELYS